MAGQILTPAVIGVKQNEGFTDIRLGAQSADKPLGRISCGFEKQSPEILLDFGRKVTGYLEIRTAGHSRDAFVIKYGPVSDCLHMKERIKMPPKLSYCGAGRTGEYYLGDYYIACRYLSLKIDSESIQAQDVFAEILSVRVLCSQYPVVYAGDFRCEEEALNTVWRRSAYTMELCMQPYRESCRYRMKDFDESIGRFSADWKGPYGTYVLLEGARRDREVWLGDVRTQALGVYTAFGAYDICKNSLALFRDLQRQDGSTVGCGSTWQNFAEYNFWGVMAAWDCYLYCGDKAFLEQAIPAVRNILQFAEARTDDRGFFPNDASWMWTIPREGYNAGTQAILCGALRAGANLERAMHFDKAAEHWEALREKIKENINRTFWDETNGVYQEDLRLILEDKPVLLDINCYAVLFDIAEEKNKPRILSYLREHMWTAHGSATMDRPLKSPRLEENLTFYPLVSLVQSAADPVAELEKLTWAHNRKVWPFINGYEVEARFHAGDTEGALELIRRCWAQSYFDETDTYWELVDPDNTVLNCGTCYYLPKDDCYNSACHGWSGWVGYLMQTYILGVKPQKAGFIKTAVAPQTGHLKAVSGSVPTPYGNIDIEIEKTDKEYKLTVTKPVEIEIDTVLSNKERNGRASVISIQNKEDRA